MRERKRRPHNKTAARAPRIQRGGDPHWVNQRGHYRCSIGFFPQTPDDNPPSYRSHSEQNGILITVGGWSENGEYQEQMEFCAQSGQNGRGNRRMCGRQELLWAHRWTKKGIFFFILSFDVLHKSWSLGPFNQPEASCSRWREIRSVKRRCVQCLSVCVENRRGWLVVFDAMKLRRIKVLPLNCRSPTTRRERLNQWSISQERRERWINEKKYSFFKWEVSSLLEHLEHLGGGRGGGEGLRVMNDNGMSYSYAWKKRKGKRGGNGCNLLRLHMNWYICREKDIVAFFFLSEQVIFYLPPPPNFFFFFIFLNGLP